MSTIWHDLPRPFFVLAPMEAVTDVVFRHVVAAAAPPDVWFSEFTNATGWVHAGEKAIGGRLIKTSDEQPIVAQIWGGEPGDMEQLAAHCRTLGYDGIDINMGCPAKSAIKSGGSALIRNPELAAEAIASAKKGWLQPQEKCYKEPPCSIPISVKTRLGYSQVEEWREWLTHLLRQDIANLTIHLRTKREMSKVPAHHELIPEIIKLRDEIAPQTLLTINGDIETRAHGEQLVRDNPGVNGVMIGRGIFHDPFCFREAHPSGSLRNTSDASPPPPEAQRALRMVAPDEGMASKTAAAWHYTDEHQQEHHKQQLIDLLYLHLDLYDQWREQTGRPYETLKRFFKIYIRDFDGASALRAQLMETKSTDEARVIITTSTSQPR